MAKSLCRLLMYMYVNHALVVNFNFPNMSFKAIRKRKFPNLQYSRLVTLNAYFANSEEPDEMLHCLLRQKLSSETEEMQSSLEIIKCESTIYTMNYLKFFYQTRRKNPRVH